MFFLSSSLLNEINVQVVEQKSQETTTKKRGRRGSYEEEFQQPDENQYQIQQDSLGKR